MYDTSLDIVFDTLTGLTGRLIVYQQHIHNLSPLPRQAPSFNRKLENIPPDTRGVGAYSRFVHCS